MITREIVNKLKVLLGLNQPGDGDEELEIHLENLALSLSQEFRGLLIRETDLTVTDSEVTFPADMVRVISLWSGDYEVMPISHEDFYKIERGGFTNDVIKIREVDGGWKGTLENTKTNGTVHLFYQIAADNISAFPQYYQRLIMLGAASDYHLFKDPSDQFKESRFKKRYEEAYHSALELHRVNRGIENRIKTQYEADWNRAITSLIVANDRDIR
jgi:hypothetical protein